MKGSSVVGAWRAVRLKRTQFNTALVIAEGWISTRGKLIRGQGCIARAVLGGNIVSNEWSCWFYYVLLRRCCSTASQQCFQSPRPQLWSHKFSNKFCIPLDFDYPAPSPFNSSSADETLIKWCIRCKQQHRTPVRICRRDNWRLANRRLETNDSTVERKQDQQGIQIRICVQFPKWISKKSIINVRPCSLK